MTDVTFAVDPLNAVYLIVFAVLFYRSGLARLMWRASFGPPERRARYQMAFTILDENDGRGSRRSHAVDQVNARRSGHVAIAAVAPTPRRGGKPRGS